MSALLLLHLLFIGSPAPGAEPQPQAEARKDYRRVAELMGDPKGRPNPAAEGEVQAILKALEGRGTAALDVHRDRLANGSFWEKSLALHLLAKLGDGANPAVPEILKATREPEAEIMRPAVRLLGKLDQSPPTIQRLAEALDDKDVGSEAAEALAEMGPRAAAAVPALVQAGKDPTRSWPHWVVALGKIRSRPDLSIPALIEAIPGYPIHAPAALASFGREARRGTPEMLRVLQGVLTENLQEQGPMVRALLIRDSVEAGLAAAYGVEKGTNVLITFERVIPLMEPEHRGTLKLIAEKLKAADLAEVVLETKPLEHH